MILDQRQEQDQRQSLGYRAYWLIVVADWHIAEAICWLALLAWAYKLHTAPLLLWNADTYEVMRGMWAQQTWALLASIGVAFHAIVTAFSWARLRIAGRFAMFLWFFFLGLMFSRSHIKNVLGGLHFALAFGAALSFLRSIAHHSRRSRD